ncbi:MAG: hypothetical protein V1489_00765 [Candidatus Liptonbacteria bacterium]
MKPLDIKFIARPLYAVLIIAASLGMGTADFTAYRARAQQISGAGTSGPMLLITWHAGTYVPADFSGKALPTTDSTITASLAVVDNGKIVNLNGQTVWWYVNNTQITSGQGVTTVKFKVPGMAPNSIALRAQLPGYPSGGIVVKTIEIPVIYPEAVIDAPFPAGTIASSSAQVSARPFFFNVKNISGLNFAWQLNSTSVNSIESPSVLNIKVDQSVQAGALVDIRLGINNPLSFAEGNSNEISLRLGSH